MSELSELTVLISGILSGNNEVRKNNEELLKGLRQKNVNEYIMYFANLLNESPHKEARIFSAVHLRRNLSSMVNSSEQSHWLELSTDTQKFVKEVLLQVLKKEEIGAVRKVVCELIGEIAATLMNIKQAEGANCQWPYEAVNWDSLMQEVSGLLASESLDLMICGLKIMSILFTFCMNTYSQHKSELAPMFKQSLAHSDHKVKNAAVDTFTSFLKTASPTDCKYFSSNIPQVISNVLELTDKDEEMGAEALANLSDVVEGEPLIFKKYWKEMFAMCKAIVQKDVSSGLKEGALECLGMLCEANTKVISKNPEAIKEIFLTVFSYMITSTEEVDDEWISPPEGFANKDEVNSQDFPINFCIELIDRLISGLDQETALPILSALLVEMVKTADWKYKFVALMALSQVGEYIEEMDELDPIMEFVIEFTQNEHPKVRYASLHAIGQIADDKKEAFQERYLGVILPKVLSLLNDNVPHVVSHCFAAITNLIEHVTKDQGMKYIDSLYEPILHWIQNGISLVRESAVTVLAVLAAACEEGFIPYWARAAEVVYDILKNANKREYKQLRGQAIECLTVTGLVVGKQEFAKIAPKIIELMAEIQKNHVEDIDPQKSYLLLGWERICKILGQDFVPFLEEIVPSVLVLIENIIQEETKTKADSNEDKEKAEVMNFLGDEARDKRELFHQVNTAHSEEIHISVDLLKVFALELKEGYIPYVERTSDLLVYLLDKSSNEDVRTAVADCLASMIGVIKASKVDGKDEIIRKIANAYIAKLWNLLWDEFDKAEDISKVVIAIKKIMIASGKYMNQQELGEFVANTLKSLKQSEVRKEVDNYLIEQTQKDQAGAKADDGDEDYEDESDGEVIDYIKENTQKEEELNCAIADLIGAVFHIYKQDSLELAGYLYKEVLPNALVPERSVLMHKFGLLLVNAMVECLGLDLIQNELPTLSEIIIKFTPNKEAELRKVAANGIRLLADVTKEHFQQISNYCLTALHEALKAPKQSGEKNELVKAAKENVVAAFGQIIKSQGQHINQKEVIGVWVNNLPLRHEDFLARIQHELLVDIVLEVDPQLVFGSNGENFAHVIKVFAEVLGTNLSSAMFEEKVGKILQILIANEGTKSLLQESVTKLNEEQQNKLKKLLGL